MEIYYLVTEKDSSGSEGSVKKRIFTKKSKLDNCISVFKRNHTPNKEILNGVNNTLRIYAGGYWMFKNKKIEDSQITSLINDKNLRYVMEGSIILEVETIIEK
jgi:hypothetical protein